MYIHLSSKIYIYQCNCIYHRVNINYTIYIEIVITDMYIVKVIESYSDFVTNVILDAM